METVKVRRRKDEIECWINLKDFDEEIHEKIEAAPETDSADDDGDQADDDDDLTLIKGVGKVVAKNLTDAGVRSFKSVSELTDASLEAAGVRDPEAARDSALDLYLEE